MSGIKIMGILADLHRFSLKTLRSSDCCSKAAELYTFSKAAGLGKKSFP